MKFSDTLLNLLPAYYSEHLTVGNVGTHGTAGIYTVF